MAEAETNRRIYGRGLRDGLRAAGVDPEEYMRNARMREAIQSLTGVTRKIFEAVPVEVAWNRHQIHQELIRSGRTYEVQSVDGQLTRLAELGLVEQPKIGYFKRVSPKPDKSKPVVKAKDKPVPQKPNDVGVLERMADIANRARALADDIDELALQADETIKRAESGSEKLRILQSLLKE